MSVTADSVSGVVSSVLVTEKVEVRFWSAAEAATRKTMSPETFFAASELPRSHWSSVEATLQVAVPTKVSDWYCRIPEDRSRTRARWWRRCRARRPCSRR